MLPRPSQYRLGVTGIETDTSGGTSDSLPRPADTLDADLHALGIDLDNAAPEPAHPPKLTRRGRVSKWDRTPPPRDWRWYVGHLGRVLIAVGVLMFAFVAYQLWGTGIENARAQAALEDDFDALLAEFDAPVASDDANDDLFQPSVGNGDSDPTNTDTDTDTDTDTEPNSAGDQDVADDAIETGGDVVDLADQVSGDDVRGEAIPVEDQNIAVFDEGDALAKIEIPDIGVSDIVVAGIQVNDLKRGPGHFPDTPIPGQLGNAAIAGHRTTYGQPFFRIDELEPGDEIRVTTLNGEFTYRVTGTTIVQPSDYQVVATTDPDKATLTLVSCHPRYTARQRIIVAAELDTQQSPTVGEPVLNYGRPDPPATAETPDEIADDTGTVAGGDSDLADDDETANDPFDDATAEQFPVEAADEADLLAEPVEQEIADVFGKGWFSDPSANPQVGLWGLALTAITIAAYLISRRTRRDWVGLMVGIVPFVVTLYFFFQNVNRLLPPNL